MLVLSSDPVVALREMNGLIFYLATFSYIDGEFDPSEMAFIRKTIKKVVEHRIDASPHSSDPAQREALVHKFTMDFEDVLQAARHEVSTIFGESVAEAESQTGFVTCRLKQRCFEIFNAFAPELQERMIRTVDELLMADGQAHPAELQFRQELLELLHQSLELPYEAPEGDPLPVEVFELDSKPHEPRADPYFAHFEHRYSLVTGERSGQLSADHDLVKAALGTLDRLARHGHGRLSGQSSVEGITGVEQFLDGNVAVLSPRPEKRYELLVLGDTHGCYSCFKAALMQSRFLEKLAAYRSDPINNPDPKLVLLGDYLDRGLYGLSGVVRLALHLFVGAPEHVYVLRGNHEMFIEHEGVIYSAVRPAESIEGVRMHASREMLLEYMTLWESLPGMLLFGRTLFVHGGIPRDALIKERVRSLEGLNDPEVKFQMLWSDPSVVDVIPRSLQEQSYRFGYGRLQCRGFLRRLGCHSMIRGHDRVDEGFRLNFLDDQIMTATIFSAGGADNRDLPEQSDYRDIRPMALTVALEGGLDGPVRVEAWPIDYLPYNSAELNGFFRKS